MGIIKIGLGRMYNAKGVKLKDIQDVSMKFILNDHSGFLTKRHYYHQLFRNS